MQPYRPLTIQSSCCCAARSVASFGIPHLCRRDNTSHSDWKNARTNRARTLPEKQPDLHTHNRFHYDPKQWHFRAADRSANNWLSRANIPVGGLPEQSGAFPTLYKKETSEADSKRQAQHRTRYCCSVSRVDPQHSAVPCADGPE